MFTDSACCKRSHISQVEVCASHHNLSKIFHPNVLCNVTDVFDFCLLLLRTPRPSPLFPCPGIRTVGHLRIRASPSEKPLGISCHVNRGERAGTPACRTRIFQEGALRRSVAALPQQRTGDPTPQAQPCPIQWYPAKGQGFTLPSPARVSEVRNSRKFETGVALELAISPPP